MVVARTYIKKVIVHDALATAEARAERLRKLRNMANLSRKDICDASDLNLNTYKGWELARFGGLPQDGAEKVIRRVARAHVLCDIDWLLYGKGMPPHVLPEPDAEHTATSALEQEMMLFRNLHQHAVVYTIDDDCMSPYYQVGDFVAGIALFGEAIQQALNQRCIVNLDGHQQLVRYLRAGAKEGQYQLLATHFESAQLEAPMIETEIHSAAPVIRHYREMTS